MQKFETLWEEERRKINLAKIVATFVSACSQGQRMHSAQTNQLGLLKYGRDRRTSPVLSRKI
jgi:hypothetical protein